MENKIDPVADIETVETELMLADLDSLGGAWTPWRRKPRAARRKPWRLRRRSIWSNRALVLLREGKPARSSVRKPEEEKAFHALGLLTSKPMLYVCNVEEAAAATGNAFSRQVEARAKQEGAGCIVVSAKIESEIAVLPRAERAEFLADIGLAETGLDRLIRAGYALLHLVTFFTVGPKETRAWTVARGARAPQAAGVIHTDFERGFIRSRPSRMKTMCSWAAKPAPATPASSGWKARTMWSPTATSCIPVGSDRGVQATKRAGMMVVVGATSARDCGSRRDAR